MDEEKNNRTNNWKDIHPVLIQVSLACKAPEVILCAVTSGVKIVRFFFMQDHL